MPPRRAAASSTAAAQAAKAKGATAARTVAGTRKAAAKPAPVKPAEKVTHVPRMSTGGRRPRGKVLKIPDLVDSEAEEVEDEDEVVKEDDAGDDEENSELMSSHNIESDEEMSKDGDSATTQNEESSDTVMPSEDDEPDTRPQVERTPKAICRGRKADDTETVSPGSPSPVKSTGAPTPVKAGAATPTRRKGRNPVVRSTPSNKWAKEDDSDDDEEDESPMKKTCTANGKGQVPTHNTDDDWDVVEVPVAAPKKAAPLLPRRNGARAPAEAALPPALKAASKSTASTKEPAKTKPSTPKTKAKATAGRKVTSAKVQARGKVPDSAEEVFNPTELPSPEKTSKPEASSSLGSDDQVKDDPRSPRCVRISKHISFPPILNALMELILHAHGGPMGHPGVLKPARASPGLVTAHVYSTTGSSYPVVSIPSLTGPHRAILCTIGVVLGCNVITPAPFAQKKAKQILLSPLCGENERKLAFLAHAFGSECLGVPTFGVQMVDGSGRINSLSFRTFPSSTATTAGNARLLPGMGAATPKKGRTPASLPSRSLIEMRDKTTWQITDDIPLWDARHLFRRGHNPRDKFSHDTVASLSRIKRELGFGEVALVYYSASTFPAFNNIHPDAVHGLSLNLYGAVSIASDV